MSNSNLATDQAPSFNSARPRETTQVGELVSKRGKRIKIGSTPYPYPTSAVMMPSRGHDKVKNSSRPLIPLSHARPLSGRDVRISETAKLGSYGNTSSNGNIG
jgi:hypothetical protein